MQKALKSSYLSYYVLKPSHLLTQGFEYNRTAQEKLFKHIFNLRERAEWKEGRRVVSYFIDFDTTKDQFRLLDPTPLDCI